jgi:hypothetical protein
MVERNLLNSTTFDRVLMVRISGNSHVKSAVQFITITLLVTWSGISLATDAAARFGAMTDNLPELPGSDQEAPAYFSLDEQSAELVYDTRHHKWGAKVDEYSYLNPSLTFDYGTLLTTRLGAGATLRHHTGYSEVMVNGVYAPKRNLRITVATGQLRTSDAYTAASGVESNATLQNSYLVDVRKNAGSGRLLSDFGITAYTVRAGGDEYADLSALAGDEMLVDSSALEAGRLDGYTLNLGLQPMPGSRIELRRERTQLTYQFGDGTQGDEFRDVNRIRVTQHFNNCARFQGRYSTTVDSDRLDLKLAQNRWSVNLSHSLDAGSRDTGVQIGYSIPLGRSQGGSGDCDSSVVTVRAFEPLIEAAAARPSQLPAAPLAEEILY